MIVRRSPERAAAARRAGAALLLAATAGVAIAAQQRPQTPVFRSRVEIVQLDVSVLDRNRRPVRDLTAADFTVIEDGKPRPIAAFTAFALDEDEDSLVTGWMRDVPADVTTNAITDSRLFIIAIDDAMIPQDPASIQHARQIVSSIIDKLAPTDLAAVVFTGDNRKTQDFTTDKTKLRAVLENFNFGLASYRFGLDTNYVETDLWFQQSSIRTLGNIAEFLIEAPNRRKALFWVSPGVPVDIRNCQPVDYRTATLYEPVPCPPPNPSLPPRDAVELMQRTDEVFRRAQQANVTIYPIDPAGLEGMSTYLRGRLGPFNERVAAHKATMSMDFLVSAAANTGGRPVINTNNFEPGITEIFDENSAYYLIGFEPAHTVTDGSLHRVEVKVNRPGVEVRARSGYYAPTPERADRRRAELSPEAEALGKAIGGLLPKSDLPMTVTLAPLAVAGQRLATVAVVLGIRQPVPATASDARVTETTELQVSAFTPEGEPRGTQRHTARVTLRAGATGEAVYEVLGRIDLAPGRYRLRLAAHNAATARDGSVFADVTVPDYAQLPMSASPVVLGATPARPSAPAGLFANILPFVPTAERTFTRASRVTSLVRLHQSGRQTVLPADVTISIRDAAGNVVVREPRSIAVDAFRSAGEQIQSGNDQAISTRRPTIIAPAGRATTSGDAFASVVLRTSDVRYDLPLARLLAGEHLLTIEAVVGTTTIRREVRFRVE